MRIRSIPTYLDTPVYNLVLEISTSWPVSYRFKMVLSRISNQFLRWSNNKKQFVLDLRMYDTEKLSYYHSHYNVRRKLDKKTRVEQFYFSNAAKFDTLPELIKYSTDNIQVKQIPYLFD